MSTQTPAKKSSRIETFDLMRGYFLVSIIINHLNYSNLFNFVTAKGSLYVSSAEGFFFISGIVLGIVRGAKLIGESIKRPTFLILKRALQLYVVYIVSTVGFTLVGWWFYMDNPGLKPGILPSDTSYWSMLWQSLTFQNLYGWLDYLRLYFFFMAAAPLAILLLRKGLWWIVVGTSLLLWYFAPTPDWPQSVFTQPYHWQVLFFGGLTVGFHWKQLSAKWSNLSTGVRKAILGAVLSVALATLIANILLAFSYKFGDSVHQALSPIKSALNPYFDKENLLPARLVMFTIWFWAAYWLFHHFEPTVKKLFGRLLLPFGTNSLYVYILSGIIIFFVHLHIPRVNLLVNTLTLVGIVAVIWLCIRTKFLMKIIPR